MVLKQTTSDEGPVSSCMRCGFPPSRATAGGYQIGEEATAAGSFVAVVRKRSWVERHVKWLHRRSETRETSGQRTADSATGPRNPSRNRFTLLLCFSGEDREVGPGSGASEFWEIVAGPLYVFMLGLAIRC